MSSKGALELAGCEWPVRAGVTFAGSQAGCLASPLEVG
jgi:hypothetical protein